MNIAKILKTEKTVFTLKDLELILGIDNQSVRNYLYRQKWKRTLTPINSWIWWVEWKDYNKFELACKLRSNSYISFETVLQKYWIIFQDYSSIVTIASDNTITKNVDNINYEYKKIKNDILYNPLWIDHKWTYAIASKERAVCDIIYLKPWFTFDNLQNIDFEKLRTISEIYNKRTILEINQLEKYAQKRNS